MLTPPASRRPQTARPTSLFALEAQKHLAAGRPRQAVEACKMGLIYYPEHVTGYVVLAKAFLALGKMAQAVNVLRDGFRRTGVEQLELLRAEISGEIPARERGRSIDKAPSHTLREDRPLSSLPAFARPVEPEAVVPSVEAPSVDVPSVEVPSVEVPTIAEHPATEPAIAEPAIAEPAIAEPSIAEPAIAEPSIAEPSVTEQPAAEPEPRIVSQEQLPVEDPITPKPAIEEPGTPEPAIEEPETPEPPVEDPEQDPLNPSVPVEEPDLPESPVGDPEPPASPVQEPPADPAPVEEPGTPRNEPLQAEAAIDPELGIDTPDIAIEAWQVDLPEVPEPAPVIEPVPTEEPSVSDDSPDAVEPQADIALEDLNVDPLQETLDEEYVDEGFDELADLLELTIQPMEQTVEIEEPAEQIDQTTSFERRDALDETLPSFAASETIPELKAPALRVAEPADAERETVQDRGLGLSLAIHSRMNVTRLRSSNLRLIPGLEFAPLRHEDQQRRQSIAALIDETVPQLDLPDRLSRTGGDVPPLPSFGVFIEMPIEEVLVEEQIEIIEEIVSTPIGAFSLEDPPPIPRSFHNRPEPREGETLTPLEELARRLEKARIPVVEEAEPRHAFEPSIVSDTFASILVAQGAYAEALKAYQTLARTKPERYEFYQHQIQDMQERILNEEDFTPTPDSLRESPSP